MYTSIAKCYKPCTRRKQVTPSHLIDVMSHIRSRLFAFAFVTTYKERFGLSYGRWLRIALFLVMLVALTQLQWVLAAVIFGLNISLRLLYRWAKKRGYATFIPRASTTPQLAHKLATDERLSVRVTGKVSSGEHEFDVLLRQGTIWQTPLNEFVLMVERTADTYLYQFIQPQHIQAVKAGTFKFGRDDYDGIKVTYKTDWSPQLRNGGLAYYVGGGALEERLKLDLYLTFAAGDETAVPRLEKALHEAM